jgi:DNA repair exonuclease SbcCD ATPase subunit
MFDSDIQFLVSKKKELDGLDVVKDSHSALSSSIDSAREKIASYDFPFTLDYISNAIQEIQRFETLQADYGQKLVTLDSEIKELRVSYVLEEKVQKFYMWMIDKLTDKYIKSLEKSLNEVFQYIYNTNYKGILLEIEEKYGKKKLVIYKVEGEHKVSLDNSGGSVSVVVGTILLIYYILFKGLPKVLIMDEAFGSIESENLDRFIDMLKEFNVRFGFDFLLVSHDDRLIARADKVYRADKEVWSLVKDRVKSEA